MDLGLLRAGAHSPSYFSLLRNLGDQQPDIVDFCIPCNPYFPSPAMFERLERSLRTILTFYPSDAGTITNELCATVGLHPQTVAMGNGSTELITWIDHLLVKESLATPIPTFGRWTDQPLETGKRVDMFQLREEQDFAFDVDTFTSFVRSRGSRVAVICNPNNPDGGYIPRREVIKMLDRLVDLDLVVVDESFIDFVDAEPHTSVADEAAIRPNVIVLKSLGKNFGLHGIRFGYLVANPSLAGRIRKALPKWNLNSFAEIVVFLLKQYENDYRRSLEASAQDRWSMSQQLASLPGLTVFASQANFVLVKLPEGVDGVLLRDHLFEHHGVYVRTCGNKLGCTDQFVRLVVRPQNDVQRLVAGMRQFLSIGGNDGGSVLSVARWSGSAATGSANGVAAANGVATANGMATANGGATAAGGAGYGSSNMNGFGAPAGGRDSADSAITGGRSFGAVGGAVGGNVGGAVGRHSRRDGMSDYEALAPTGTMSDYDPLTAPRPTYG